MADGINRHNRKIQRHTNLHIKFASLFREPCLYLVYIAYHLIPQQSGLVLNLLLFVYSNNNKSGSQCYQRCVSFMYVLQGEADTAITDKKRFFSAPRCFKTKLRDCAGDDNVDKFNQNFNEFPYFHDDVLQSKESVKRSYLVMYIHKSTPNKFNTNNRVTEQGLRSGLEVETTNIKFNFIAKNKEFSHSINSFRKRQRHSKCTDQDRQSRWNGATWGSC